jgi:DNA polymerase-3 subunit epsilon
MSDTGIENRAILETPLAVVDLETTGFCAGPDKILEIAVARIEPGKAPAVVLNTLIDPHRPVTATEIHGITDADVAGAPSFPDVAGNVTDAVQDAVLSAYNVYFDAKFLGTELGQVGVRQLPPQLCLMYLRPMLGLGRKCTLYEACSTHGVSNTSTHVAGLDVLASAQLWQFYTTILSNRGIQTFAQLAALKSYKFTNSFTSPFIDSISTGHLHRTSHLKPRSAQPQAVQLPDNAVGEYWEAVLTALADFELTQEELAQLKRRRKELPLTEEQTRWVHAKAFSGLLAEVIQDRAITATEAETLWQVARALRALGWAPGDSLNPAPQSGPSGPQPGFFDRLFGSSRAT